MKSKSLLPIAAAAVLTLSSTSCASRKSVADVSSSDQAVAVRPADGQPLDEAFSFDADETTVEQFAKGNNEMAFRLFREMKGFDSKVVSPLSISYLMGMLANGADGETRAEIIRALQCEGLTLDQINGACRILMQKDDKDAKATVNVANYVAVNHSFQLKKPFADILRQNYGADVESLDFTKRSTLGRINGWCSKQTDGMIPRFLDEVDPSAVSYVLNAIYFNGTWSKPFEKSDTHSEAFHGYTRDRKMTDMMHQESKFDYCETENYSAVNLPYTQSGYGMTILLPKEGKSVDDVMGQLNAEALAELPSKMENCLVDLKMPRFTTSTTTPLNQLIAQLGANRMFSEATADFSRLADGFFFVQQMMQKARIEVTEKGTRAAAVTGAMIATTSLSREPRRVEFHANRPFLYFITQYNTGAILFMGSFMGNEL